MVVIVKDNVAVSVKNVGMCFNQSQERVDNLKEYLIKFVRRDLKYDEFWALRDVDFQIKKGERLGVLGLNGSGKSTLLRVVSIIKTNGWFGTDARSIGSAAGAWCRISFRVYRTREYLSVRSGVGIFQRVFR